MARAKKTRWRNPQTEVAAALKMAEWAHKAKELQAAGKIKQARAALRKAEHWRKLAGA